MKKPITRVQHGIADYSYIPLVAIAPEIFDFENERAAKLLCRVQSGSTLLYSVFTKAEWGLFREIPYKTHLTIDFSVGLLSLGAPWLLGFSKNHKARNTFLALGVTGILVSLLSKPEEM